MPVLCQLGGHREPPDPDSRSQTEQLLAEPEVQQLVAIVSKGFHDFAERNDIMPMLGEPPKELKGLNKEMAEWLAVALDASGGLLSLGREDGRSKRRPVRRRGHRAGQ